MEAWKHVHEYASSVPPLLPLLRLALRAPQPPQPIQPDGRMMPAQGGLATPGDTANSCQQTTVTFRPLSNQHILATSNPTWGCALSQAAPRGPHRSHTAPLPIKDGPKERPPRHRSTVPYCQPRAKLRNFPISAKRVRNVGRPNDVLRKKDARAETCQGVEWG